MPTYKGLSGKTYSFSPSSKIGSGGEGVIYDMPGLAFPSVVKLYHESELLKSDAMKQRQEKLEAMVRMKIDPRVPDHKGEQKVIIAWPSDTLYESSTGRFVGYIMPKIYSKMTLESVYGEATRTMICNPFTMEKACIVAINFTESIRFLHQRKITMGDLNPQNFLVMPDSTIVIVDADTCAFDYNGKRFNCLKGVPEILPPELQGRIIGSAPFTEYSDRFQLADLIYHLLIQSDAFGVLQKSTFDSKSGITQVEGNIVNGYCATVTRRLVESKGRNIKAAYMMESLPAYIRELFDRAFDYNAANAVKKEVIAKRPSADEWAVALRKMWNRGEGFAVCHASTNPKEQHMYPKSCTTGCPWCNIDQLSHPGTQTQTPIKPPSSPQQPKKPMPMKAPGKITW